MVWQVGGGGGGAKGHGAELMINIALVSMHAILYIDILGPTFVIHGGGMTPLFRHLCCVHLLHFVEVISMAMYTVHYIDPAVEIVQVPFTSFC